MRNVCPCIGELLAAATAIEALEHNAIQSKMWMALGQDLRLRNRTLFEELSLEHEYLAYPIRERIAEVYVVAWLGKVEEKCGIEMGGVMDRLHEAKNMMDAGRFSEAQAHYMDAKSLLHDRVIEFCSV